MRSITTISLLTLSLAFLGPALAEDGDTPDDSVARVYCVAFTKTGDAASQSIEKAWLGKIRTEFADKNVLFITADLTSKGSRHQAKLLLNGLGLEDLWRSYASKPGTVVAAEAEWGRVLGAMTSKTTPAEARATLTKGLTPAAGMDGDDDDDDDE